MVDVIDMQLERLNTRFEGLTDILERGSDQSHRLCHIVEWQAILRLSFCHQSEWLMLQKKIYNITDAMLLQKKNETPYFVNTDAHSAVHRLFSTLNLISGKCLWRWTYRIKICWKTVMTSCVVILMRWNNSLLAYLSNDE